MNLLLFTTLVVVGVQSHNWLNLPSRSVLSSEVNPCIASSNGGKPHVRVQPGQLFQIEWSTGHDSFHYFIFVKESDFDHLKKHANEDILIDYFKNAPKDQDVRPQPLFTKYHRKLRTNEFTLAGELFNGKRGGTLTNYLKREMKRGEDPLYAVRPSQFKGEYLKETGDNTYTNCYHRPGDVNPDNVYQYEHQEHNNCLNDDRRVTYHNPKYPWIIGAYRYRNCQHDAFHSDFTWASFPKDLPLGRYFIHYTWRGFFDVVDVELTKDYQEFPYGTNFYKYPPSQSKFKDLKVPPVPGLDTAPPTPVPTTVPPTPVPVIPKVKGKLTLWHRCTAPSGGAATATPATPPGAKTGAVTAQRGVRMLFNQFLCHDWQADGDVKVTPGGMKPLEHGVQIEVNAGNAAHAKSVQTVSLDANRDYTVEFWYYATSGNNVYAGVHYDVAGTSQRLFVRGARTGATNAFTITDEPQYGLRVVAAKAFADNRYMLRMRFATKAAGTARFGISAGEPGSFSFFQLAVGVATGAGDASALMHSRADVEAGTIAVLGANDPLTVTPFVRGDANGAGRFSLKADGSILFEDVPAVRSPRTLLALSGASYMSIDFTAAYVPTTPPANDRLEDASGYHRHGTLHGTRVASSTVVSACQSVANKPVATLAPFDLYGTAFSVALWFAADADSGTGRLLHKAGETWSISLNAANKVAAEIDTANGRVAVDATVTAWKKDEYHHVGVTYDGASVKLFYDGKQVVVQAATGAVKANPGGAVLLGAGGSSASPTMRFSGKVADVRVYQSVVDMGDVTAQRGTMPGGARARDQFARVDHCAYHWSAYDMQGTCRRLEGTEPDACLAECAAMATDECDGVSIQPLQPADQVYAAFRDVLLLPKHASCTREALTAGQPATDRSFGCFALKLGRSERFFQVEDFEDPAYYGSCFVRVPLESDDVVEPLPLAPLSPATVFHNGCLECSDAEKNAPNGLVPIWKKAPVCEQEC